MAVTVEIQRDRQEGRIVRPFRGLHEVEELFKGVELSVDSRVCAGGAKRERLSPLELEAGALTLMFRFSQAELILALESTGVQEVDLALVVIARARTYRLARTIYMCPLGSGSLPGELPIDRSRDPLIFGDSGGFDIRVAVVLTSELQPQSLQPSRRGTWRTRHGFYLRPDDDVSGFSLNPLTQEIRALHGIPEETFSFVNIEMDDLREVESILDAVTVYVDEEALRFIHADENDLWSVFLQTSVAVEIFVMLLAAAASPLDDPSFDGTEPSSDSGLGRFVARVARQLSTTNAALLQMAKESPAELQAQVEALLGLKTAALRALKED